MNDLLFGNNNAEIVKRLSKRYFKKNRIRNIAAILAIMLTASMRQFGQKKLWIMKMQLCGVLVSFGRN